MADTLQHIVFQTMQELQHLIIEGAETRGKNATGRTAKSILPAALSGPTFATGTLSINSNWRYWGSGRGPGGMPPISEIIAWKLARGLSNMNPWAVARKISRKGTFDFRAKRTNLVLDEIAEWEKTALGRVDIAAADNLTERLIEVLKRSA